MISNNLFSRAPSPPISAPAPAPQPSPPPTQAGNLDSLLRGLGQPSTVAPSQPQPQPPTERQTALLSLLGSAVDASPAAQPQPDHQGKKLLDQLMAGTQPSQPSPPPPAPSPTRKSMFEFVSPFDALASSSPSKRKPVPPMPSHDGQSNPSASASGYAATYDDPAILSASRDNDSPRDANTPREPDRNAETKMTMESLMEQLARPPMSQISQGPSDPYTPSVYPHAFAGTLPMSFSSAHAEEQNTYPILPHDSYPQSSPPPRVTQGPPPPLPPKPSAASPVPRSQQHPPPSPRPSPPRLNPTPPLRRSPPPRPYEDIFRVPENVPTQPQRVFTTTLESPAGSGRDTQGGQSPPQRYSKPNNKEGGSRNKGSGGERHDDSRNRGHVASASKGKSTPPANFSAQTITIDVAQPLTSTLAPRESVAVTPIALLKLDAIYVPGSTIGVSSWIAYAMTKGRVRLIARSNGARALLKLPTAFPPTSSVVDMVCSANRLAGVTSDGGLVVWEVPNMIDDDLPSKLLLCVLPTAGPNAFKTIKWHPRQPSLLAVGSDKEIHLINVDDALDRFRGDPIRQFDLGDVRTLFSVPSTLVSFAFDVPHYAIASISVDSTLTLWSIRDKLPFWTSKVLGESTPSSIDFLDGGIIIGRKQGTVLQLVPVMANTAVSTVKFVNSAVRGEDKDMFGHVGYDPRIQTLWVANSRRESLIALRVYFEPATVPSSDLKPGQATGTGYFEQVLEFPILHPTINVGILTAEAAANPIPNPHLEPGTEQKQVPPPPGAAGGPEMALVAFVVHTGGVDQVLINKDAFESAADAAPAKLPSGSQYPVLETKRSGGSLQGPTGGNGTGLLLQSQVVGSSSTSAATLAPPRARTPLSDIEPETEIREEVTGRPSGGKSKPGKKENGKEKANEPSNEMITALAKEIRKVEENLHTRIGRLIAKELDKQHTRIEDGRQASQQADLTRQDMLIRLISTELTKNTTRVVELAIKNVVQTTVLPSLETITKDEVKAALNSQIVKGLGDSMKQTLPNEIERLLLRPDVSNHVARTFSSAVTPIIERHVKDAINKTLVPAYMQATSQLHQDLSSEIRGEILNLKKEIVSWQSKALQGHENLIHSMESSIRALSDQVKALSTSLNPGMQQQHMIQAVNPPPHRSSPAPSISSSAQAQLQGSHLRQTSLPHGSSPAMSNNNYNAPTNYSNQPPIVTQWYNTPLVPAPPMQQQAPPQSMGIPNLPPPPPAPPLPSVMSRPSEDWDGAFLGVLGTQDPRQLRELLARSNPETIMPSSPGAVSPLSQAVVLTLVHRLASALGETSPVDESFKSSLWWLQRAAYTLNPSDPVISPYVGRVVPNVKALLQTTSQRLALLPGGTPLIETNRMISDILQTINNKPPVPTV